MRLIMAVSKDGYVARHARDDMSWLGRDDKALFRALTSVGGACWVGRRSAEAMPADLPGRTLHLLGTGPGLAKLEHLRYARYEGDWLLGGQELAIKALAYGLLDVPEPWRGMVQEIHLCRSDRCAFPQERGHFDRITPMLMAYGLTPAMRTRFGDVHHEVWRPEGPVPGAD